MKLLEPHETALSNHCVICAVGLSRDKAPIVVDTLIDFDLPGHPLDGRKLVCQGCVNDIASAVGLFSASQLADAKDYLTKYRAAIEDQRAGIENALETLNATAGTWPAPPNLDHLNAPKQTLAAETAIVEEVQRSTDWVSVNPDEAF